MKIDTMTTEQKRIRIAEAIGWKVKDLPLKGETYFALFDPTGKQRGGRWRTKQSAWTQPLRGKPKMPDVLNSLDAMHEAEKVLDEHQRYLYLKNIADTKYKLDDAWAYAHATAAERADAFLLVLPEGEG